MQLGLSLSPIELYSLKEKIDFYFLWPSHYLIPGLVQSGFSTNIACAKPASFHSCCPQGEANLI